MRKDTINNILDSQEIDNIKYYTLKLYYLLNY